MSRNMIRETEEVDEENGEGDEEAGEFEEREQSVQRQANGLPRKSPYPDFNPSFVYPLFMLLFLLVGTGIAYLIHMYAGGKANSDAKMAILRKYELGYLYLALVVLSWGPKLLDTIVAQERAESHASVPDQYVYKVMRPATTIAPSLSYILLETNGPVGRFNRAQRAAGNLGEKLPTHLALSAAAGFIFPLPVLVLSVLFVIFKVIGAFGYARSTKERMGMPGFLIAAVVEGMVLFAGLGALPALSS